MSNAPELHAIDESTFTLLGVDLSVYVLNDGQRVIDANDMSRLVEELDRTGQSLAGNDEVLQFIRRVWGHQ